MKRFFTLLFSFCLVMATSGEEVLVIGTGEFPPITSEREDQSFLTLLIEEIGQRIGVRFEFRFMPWVRGVDEMRNHNLWGVIPYVKTEERLMEFFFSDPLYWTNTSFFYYSESGPKTKKTYEDLEELSRFKLAGVRGYYYVAQLRKLGIPLEEVTTDVQMILMSASGRIDLFPMNEAVARHLIRQSFPEEKWNNFHTLEPPFLTTSSQLMTSPTHPANPEMLVKFNEALREMRASGRLEAMRKEFGVAVRVISIEN